jgi:hypothetical protein
MQVMTVKLPKTLARWVERQARGKRVSKSAIVRDCLEQASTQPGLDKTGPSCLDLARDLAGCFEGPRDLSTNKSYLKGLGGQGKRAR